MPDGPDTRRSVDLQADIALVGQLGLAGVEPDPKADDLALDPAANGQAPLDGQRGLDGRRGSGEDGEVLVGASVDLDTARASDEAGHEAADLQERLRPACPEARRQGGRAFDVGEQEGHPTAWQALRIGRLGPEARLEALPLDRQPERGRGGGQDVGLGEQGRIVDDGRQAPRAVVDQGRDPIRIVSGGQLVAQPLAVEIGPAARPTRRAHAGLRHGASSGASARSRRVWRPARGRR